jgi:hypothetical protein
MHEFLLAALVSLYADREGSNRERVGGSPSALAEQSRYFQPLSVRARVFWTKIALLYSYSSALAPSPTPWTANAVPRSDWVRQS